MHSKVLFVCKPWSRKEGVLYACLWRVILGYKYRVALTCISFIFLNASVEHSSGVGGLGEGKDHPTAGIWVGCGGNLCWGFSLGVGAERPTAHPAFGPPSGVCLWWHPLNWVWRRGGKSLWPWPPLKAWRRRGTSSPRLLWRRRLA